jgi:hypothetical protein
MLILIFIVTLLLGLSLGGLWIKRIQRKLNEERERKLKIAEGKWDEVKEKVRKPSRIGNAFRKAGGVLARLKPRGAPEIDDDVQVDQQSGVQPDMSDPRVFERAVRRALPPACEELLNSWRAYTLAVKAVDAGESAYTEAKATAESLARALNERLVQGNLGSWLQEYMDAVAKERAAGRAYNVVHSELTPLRTRWKAAMEALSKRKMAHITTQREHVILPDSLSKQHHETMGLADLILSECSTVLDPPRSVRPPVGWELPAQPLPEGTEDPVFKTVLPELKTMVEVLRKMSVARHASEKERVALEQLLASLSLGQPSKPTEEEVQTFIESSLSSAEVVLKQSDAYAATEAALWPAMDGYYGHKNSVNRSVLDFVESFKTSVDKPNQPKIVTWEDFTELDPTSAPALADERKPVDWRKLPISDKCRAVLEAAYCVTSCAFIKMAHDEFKELGQYRQRYTEEMTSVDDNSLAALRNALRKLGFALAQDNAAYEKYKTAENTPAQIRALHEPTLVENNADKYIRAHRRWHDDQEHNSGLASSRQAKIDALIKQYKERNKQVPLAADQLRELLRSTAIRTARATHPKPRKLAVAIRAAQLLRERFDKEWVKEEQDDVSETVTEDVVGAAPESDEPLKTEPTHVETNSDTGVGLTIEL